MKISYDHIAEHINVKPSLREISDKLFQLGHEHEIDKNIFDIEFTPNRGDCLSVNGILRDLRIFYDIKPINDIYTKKIDPLSIDFTNNVPKACPRISFLKIEIEEKILTYSDHLKKYFEDLNIKKNNFFTDISNYIAYEMGQPTHCYDLSKLNYPIYLDYLDGNYEFETLLDKKILLSNKNLVFKNQNNIINFAGIVGGKGTACDHNTRSVLVECAYFNPEEIIGKSLKYDIQSDAAYKFERNVDPKCHENVLRRFIQVVKNHSTIKSLQICTHIYDNCEEILIPLDITKINKIIGIDLKNEVYENYLCRLGFTIKDDFVHVPSYRSDITSQNDLSEEIARAIGYDNIPVSKFSIPYNSIKKTENVDIKIKSFLNDKGFYEVINNPFVSDGNKKSIKIDNPLDTNKEYLRSNLKNSLIENLLYNERRQKDSVKLFESSDVYNTPNSIKKEKIIGVIASGRVGNNYIDFSKKIKNDFLNKLFHDFIPSGSIKFQSILRDGLQTKIKTPIVYAEIRLDDIKEDVIDYDIPLIYSQYPQYIPISEYPSSLRDLSFSIKKYDKSLELEKLIMNYDNNLLKNVFIFDYYKNEKMQEIKIGFRFTFQSNKRTITDKDVNIAINDIVELALKIDSVTLPGLS